MKTLNFYFNKALKEGWAIPQFNFSNLEILKAIVWASKSLDSPIILGTSEGESRFLGLEQAAALVGSIGKENHLPLFLNLDHARSFDYCKKAIEAGYDTVHFDGSGLEFNENLKIVKKLVKYAHQKKIMVEGEIDEIGSANLTDPGTAALFCQKTGIDRLAVNIGTFHGKEGRIDISLLKEIKEKTGNIPLVLHGGSGAKAEDVIKAIRLGIAKINVNTELRAAFTRTLRNTLNENPNEIVPYKYMPNVIEAIKGVLEEKIKLFGSANKA